MCEKPKDEDKKDERSSKQSDRDSYYYDDAHGYEEYDPANDEDEEDESA